MISPSKVNRVNGLLHYICLLVTLFYKRKLYEKIHFIWNILLFIELPFFLLFKDKLVFTYHNDVPHSYPRRRYLPYWLIMKMARKIVFVSNYTQRRFINNYGKHKSNYLLQHGVMPIGDLETIVSKKLPVVEKNIIFWGKVEEYKGVDIFNHYDLKRPIEIYGKWSLKLFSLKQQLNKLHDIHIFDNYLSTDELAKLMNRKAVFILPYKNATQSGVLYTLLAYGKVFISSNVGENSGFLINHGLEKLIFDRKDEDSILSAIDYALNNYEDIQTKMLVIKDEYKWSRVLRSEIINDLYDD